MRQGVAGTQRLRCSDHPELAVPGNCHSFCGAARRCSLKAAFLCDGNATITLERVRERIEERQFQVFDLNVMKAWPAKDVAQTLGISVARIYLTKHRVTALLKKEGDW